MQPSKIIYDEVGIMQLLKDYWWLLTSILGVIAYVAATAIKAHDLLRRLTFVEERQKQEREDIAMLLQAQFATLDGLKQLKCDGNVTKAYETMQQYVLSRH
jgi:hypothetical protein